VSREDGALEKKWVEGGREMINLAYLQKGIDALF
jgi:hypothetical protein